ncbi:MAG: hypothetical protein KY469_02040 [Actinobacteria bacterium]|nr:hypothetical protein [Actinomycetota bacterium]
MPRAVATVSASPLLLPALTPNLPHDIAADIARLRAAAADALRVLGSGPVIVLAPGEPGIADAPRTALGGFGLAGLDVELPGAPDLASTLRGATTPDANHTSTQLATLDVDASVLVHALASSDATVPTVVRQVGPGDDAEALLERLAEADAAVLLAGDLSACLHAASPGYVVHGASEWEAEVVTALSRGDLDALRRADADAGRVGARSWPLPRLAAALACERDLQLQGCVHIDARGLGRVVAWWT